MNKDNYIHSELTEKIIGEVYYVYNNLGPGFLEKVYENAMLIRLKKIGLDVEQQRPINVFFEGELIGQFFADLFVENKVIIELKACEKIIDIFEVQLVSYLKATGIQVGLLINFGPKLEIKRRVYQRKS
jgi:GxxExxY protein